MKWWLRLIWAMGCLLLLAACLVTGPTDATNLEDSNAEEAGVNSSKAFDLIYGASGGQPFVDARLHITADGRSDMYLGSSWSLPGEPLDKVGYFAGTISAEKQAALKAQLTRSSIMTGADEMPTSADPTTRYLTVTLDGQETKVTLTGRTKEPALAELEEMLLATMADLVTEPVRSVQVTLSVQTEGSKLQPEVTIANIGRESLPIVLSDPASTGQLLGVTYAMEQAIVLSPDLTAWQPHVTETIPADYIQTLFDSGELPLGVQHLAAGEAYKFALPPIAKPSDEAALHLSATVTFWLPGSGLERRLVSVQTLRLPVQ